MLYIEIGLAGSGGFTEPTTPEIVYGRAFIDRKVFDDLGALLRCERLEVERLAEVQKLVTALTEKLERGEFDTKRKMQR